MQILIFIPLVDPPFTDPLAEKLLDNRLYIRIQIQTIQLLIFTGKFSPLPGFEPRTSMLPSRYATNWAILAWIHLGSNNFFLGELTFFNGFQILWWIVKAFLLVWIVKWTNKFKYEISKQWYHCRNGREKFWIAIKFSENKLSFI